MSLHIKHLIFEALMGCLIGLATGMFLAIIMFAYVLALIREDENRTMQYTTVPVVRVVDWQAVADEEVKQRAHELDAMSDQERMRGIVYEPEN